MEAEGAERAGGEGAADREEPATPAGMREARYRYSPAFPELLRRLGASLLVSTYQAGKLVAIGAAEDGLSFSFHSFDQAMGVAIDGPRMAVGARGQIWFMRDNPDIATRLPPPGRFDRCFLPRSTTVTGAIHCHELAWGRPAGGSEAELWVVNTLFSCLATLDPGYSFVPRWRPPFVSELAAEDRCHLNGVAMRDGAPAYVTAMARSDSAGGWREKKNETGCVFDVDTGEVVTRGLAMPHSPRWHRGRLHVLNSGCGTLEVVHLESGERSRVAAVPGYARGLACIGDIAFIGLSRIRETAVFGGVPIAERHDELECGVGVVNLQTGITLATLEFESGVEEIFDVQVLANARCPALGGQDPEAGNVHGEHEIWVVPQPSGEPSWVAPQRSAPVGEEPTDEQVRGWLERALVLQRGDDPGREALALLRRAAQVRPGSAEILNRLGNALQDAGQQAEAVRCYRRAISKVPNFAPALQNLGYVLVDRGRTDEGIGWLHKAQALEPRPVNRALIATALPVVYASAKDVHERRAKLEARVGAMVDEGVEIDAKEALVPTSFFTAYQGFNDRPVAERLGAVYRGLDACGARRARKGRPRIGFLSAYFRDHTIGRLNIGRIERLSRQRFEPVVLTVGSHRDPLAARFAAAGERFVSLPRDVAAARAAIAAQQLDMLFFADVGMDALTYTLSFSRMAPVQATSWGHPVTTGSPRIDLFLSSELLEVVDADQHYSEQLVRRPSLCTYYESVRSDVAPLDRAELGLGADSNLYLCPQTLFKFHPDFDQLLGSILERDPGGELVLIEGRAREWTEQLDERLRLSLPEPSRLRWIEPLPRPRFLGLVALADVVLDTIHFGGGNTSYEALALGKPVVTLPSELLRGRITRALYEKSGYMDLVADSPERFVEIAVELGTDRDRRAAAAAAIADSCPVLFEDEEEVTDFEGFLAEALG